MSLILQSRILVIYTNNKFYYGSSYGRSQRNVCDIFWGHFPFSSKYFQNAFLFLGTFGQERGGGVNGKDTMDTSILSVSDLWLAAHCLLTSCLVDSTYESVSDWLCSFVSHCIYEEKILQEAPPSFTLLFSLSQLAFSPERFSKEYLVLFCIVLIL